PLVRRGRFVTDSRIVRRMARGLVIVDIQNDYFPGGANPLEGPEAAAAQAARLLARFRESGDPLVHMQHVWDAPDAAFMAPGTAGVEIHESVAPRPGETVIQKRHPNSFLDTELEQRLRDAGVDRLVVCGMMTSMCVDATVRAGADLGFPVVVAHDACATMPLEFKGRTIPAADVHAAFLAALADSYAEVVGAGSLVDGR
ncbi:MAG TPA: cysteine hydrolase family protein, partial [Gaiellales bacterium]|nr:cysteine hydrolase family protein [Gaiellales bacterium]